MKKALLDIPVVFIIFNRPELTKKTFNEIAKARPKTLLVIADGPRINKPEDVNLCAATREIIEHIDWECSLLTNYSDKNMGCGRRISTGLSWAFDHVEEAIILEDDCLPHPDFFHFCRDLLDKYRNNPKIMMISGTNILGDWNPAAQSYHYSYYGSIWGWATWRRAWSAYDFSMKQWVDPDVKQQIKDLLNDAEQFEQRDEIFSKMCGPNAIDTWDTQWTFARLYRAGLAVVPSVNLISNHGFSEQATHTKEFIAELARLPTYPLSPPLTAPAKMEADREFDRRLFSRAGSAVSVG